MKYKCLVFDHDDTVVRSTELIHYPCFAEYLKQYRPGRMCTFDQYIKRNFDPGFIQMCKEDYAFSDSELEEEIAFWKAYVAGKIPTAFDGIREIMERHLSEGGILCVVSHSMEENIYRDFEYNGLPTPDAVYGWSRPINERKPSPFPLLDIMKNYSLEPSQLLVIDDLKPGYDMACACGVDFAAVGWAYNVREIEDFMRKNSKFYFKSVDQLDGFLS